MKNLISQFLLNSNTKKAMLLDSFLLQNVVSLYPCSSYLIPNYLNSYEYTMIFSSSLEENLKNGINNALYDFQSSFM